MTAWVPDQFRLTGGLNLEDPAFTQPPGFLAYCSNYEALAGGGYRRVDGYERYDGHLMTPSSASYQWFYFVFAGKIPFAVDDVLTGGDSGAVGTICVPPDLRSFDVVHGTFGAPGSGKIQDYAGGNANGIIVVATTSGQFVAGDTLTVTGAGSTKIATVFSDASLKSISDPLYKTWLAGARNQVRAGIGVVGDSTYPGSGQVLGGFVLNGVTYAIRNGTQFGTGWDPLLVWHDTQIYKATESGWQHVVLTKYIQFYNGTIEVNEGDIITGASSSAVATVRRVNVGAGNWAGPTFASGRFAIDTITGTFTADENLQVSAVTVAQAKAAQQSASLTLNAAGPGDDLEATFNTCVYNFYGASNDRRVYGCNGWQRAWEFDGTIFCNIETGMAVDAPTYVEAHRNNLFLAFPGGSLQNSATGLPLVWSARLGAAELGVGDDITGMRTNGNNTLGVTCLKSTQVVQGTSDLDWSLRGISNEIGSIANTIQEAGGQTVFLDRAGVNVIIPAPFAYQDLSTQAISRNIRKTIERTAFNCVGSQHAINKSQYRLFFNDKTVLTATFFGTKLMGWMQSQFAHQGTVWWSGPDASGNEQMYMGTSDGYCMQLDVGTSFDGRSIQSILRTPYNYHKSPNRDKRFHKVTLEVDTPHSIDLRLKTDFEYGNTTQGGTFDNQTVDTGGTWDVSKWDQFFWDSAQLSSPEINIDGVARNIALTIYHNDDVDESFVVSAAMIDFSIWGIKR